MTPPPKSAHIEVLISSLTSKRRIKKESYVLRLGDVVRLNSGGPPCLVVDLDGRGNVVVAWRAPDGEMQEHKAPNVCFTIIDPVD